MTCPPPFSPIFPLDAGRKTGYFDAIFLEELSLETMGNNRIKTRKDFFKKSSSAFVKTMADRSDSLMVTENF